jgi:outer membrane protein OmpA-like peptidoglycan-associated protein
MRRATSLVSFGIVFSMLCFGLGSYARDAADEGQLKFAVGQKAKVAGEIVKRANDSFVLRNDQGEEVLVKLTAATEVKEKKSNPFRGAKNFSADQLVRGLKVEVEGLGDESGALAARDVRFTQTQYLVANSVEARVTPVEGRLTDTEDRLTRSEENAKHLSGQVEETRDLANSARGSAKTAQETADAAIAGVNAAKEQIAAVDQSTNARITALDDFEPRSSVAVHFKVNSADLTPEAKAQLDSVVKGALSEKGYVVEVKGFASSDGNPELNRVLSQRRADAVVQYLADNMVPLRRIVTPFGYGEMLPAADNKTHAGREENRRVEVSILVSKGLAAAETQAVSNSKIQK